MSTIHPNDLTPSHVNRKVVVTLPDGTEVRGPLGPYQHEIKWISDLRVCDVTPNYVAGRTRTEFRVGGFEAVVLTDDRATITFLDEKEA